MFLPIPKIRAASEIFPFVLVIVSIIVLFSISCNNDPVCLKIWFPVLIYDGNASSSITDVGDKKTASFNALLTCLILPGQSYVSIKCSTSVKNVNLERFSYFEISSNIIFANCNRSDRSRKGGSWILIPCNLKNKSARNVPSSTFFHKSLCVAVINRTSTFLAFVLPIRFSWKSCNTRDKAIWIFIDNYAISSKNSVPPFACSKTPAWPVCLSPVKAPGS